MSEKENSKRSKILIGASKLAYGNWNNYERLKENGPKH